MKNTINLTLVAVLFLTFGLACKDNAKQTQVANQSSVQTTPTATAVATPEITAKVTAATFAQLKTGMKYADVVKILGSEGEVLSESELGGTKTVMYQWKGDGISNMNAMFQNNKLINKAQFGLK